MYGDRVDVAYYDAASPEVEERFHSTLESASERYLRLPLVLIDDRIIQAGHVDAYAIAASLAQRLS